MSLFCPLCRKEVTSEVTKCPWCRYDFRPRTFNVVAMSRDAPQKDVIQRRKHLRVVQGSKFAFSRSK